MKRRLEEHNRGKEKFTSTGIPWVLVYQEAFEELKAARSREVFIKKQKSRIFIEKLIRKAGECIPIAKSGGSLVRIQSGALYTGRH